MQNKINTVNKRTTRTLNMASTSFCGFINSSQSETVPWEHWEPTATHAALLLPHWPAGGDRAAEQTQTCGGRQRGVELTQTCRGRQGAGLLPEAATAEQWDLQFSPTQLKIMALTVQTKPRPPGSDPDTRKNDNNYRKSVLHTDTKLTLDQDHTFTAGTVQ